MELEDAFGFFLVDGDIEDIRLSLVLSFGSRFISLYPSALSSLRSPDRLILFAETSEDPCVILINQQKSFLACISLSDTDTTFLRHTPLRICFRCWMSAFCSVNRLSSSGYRLLCGTFLKTSPCYFCFVTQYYIDFIKRSSFCNGKSWGIRVRKVQCFIRWHNST